MCCPTFTFPTVSADSVQAGWAYTNDVNLIASGYSMPAMSGGGSGIYAGRDGPLVMVMPDRPGTQIIVSRVLKRKFPDSECQSKKCSIDSSYRTFVSDYLVLPYGKENSAPSSNRPSDLRSVKLLTHTFLTNNPFRFFFFFFLFFFWITILMLLLFYRESKISIE
jgi:hypothetical protein